ncbi:MAG: hypothetical protein ABWX65_01635 [Mycetocola sp.]
MMFLLILLVAAVVFATIATVAELRRDGYRRIPERSFGPAANETVDASGRSLLAGMR